MRTRLTAGFPLSGTAFRDLLERSAGPAEVQGPHCPLALRPFEIVTLRLYRTTE